jgi:hypothetical protein
MTETERHSLAQLESTLAAYGHLLETEWYRALFDADEIAALSAFFAKVAHHVRRDVVRDVDDGALDDPEWREVMAAARSLHSRLIAAGRILPTTSAS